MDGNAADCVPEAVKAGTMTMKQAYELVQNSNIQYDQLIYEFGEWVHISKAPAGRAPRRQAIMIGKWTGGKYAAYDASLIPG
jgi:hypothetical protein